MIPYEQLAAALEKRAVHASPLAGHADAADLTQAGSPHSAEDPTSANLSADASSDQSGEYEIGDEVLSDEDVHS
jgi:hypothetical protein